MTEREFIVEVKRGLGIIIKAMIRYYGLSWSDFLPRLEGNIVGPLAGNQTATPLPIVPEIKR